MSTDIVKKSRAELRASIFAPEKTNPTRTELTYNGEIVEFLSPSIAALTRIQQSEGRNPVLLSMIENCVLPGTNERVFDDADYDAMVNSPVTPEFLACVDKISKILNVSVEDKVKN